MPQHGSFAWNELNTWEPAKARAFYETAFGWSFTSLPMGQGEYLVASHGGTAVAGILDLGQTDLPKAVPNHWFSYLEVDDVDARAKAALGAGGQVRKEPFSVPGVGRIAIVQDATGAVFGIITSAPAGA